MGIMSKETNRTLKEQFMLRLPDGMRDRIKAAADANKRSMTQEIVATLEEAYPEPDPQELASSVIDLMNELFEIRSKAGATQEEAARIKRAYDELTRVGNEIGSPEDDGFDAKAQVYRNKHLLAEIELVEALLGSKIANAEGLKKKLQKSIRED